MQHSTYSALLLRKNQYMTGNATSASLVISRMLGLRNPRSEKSFVAAARSWDSNSDLVLDDLFGRFFGGSLLNLPVARTEPRSARLFAVASVFFVLLAPPRREFFSGECIRVEASSEVINFIYNNRNDDRTPLRFHVVEAGPQSTTQRTAATGAEGVFSALARTNNPTITSTRRHVSAVMHPLPPGNPMVRRADK
jgi:hypothetical protein